jgi:bleomycin hydrolase
MMGNKMRVWASLIITVICFAAFEGFAQEAETKQEANPKYEFTIQKSLACTPVKSQDKTGTCWSFATASFIESEMMRRGKGEHDLSEMFIVKNIYKDKALNYVLRHGKANYSQGALAHDFINAAWRHGIVPEEVYSGKQFETDQHDHGEMEMLTKGMLEGVIKRPRPSSKWNQALCRVLDTYLGESPERFTYQGRSYSPQEFAASLDFRKDDYISLSSYSHHPFYEEFVLEIPDNFSNGSFLNLPIDDLVETIDHAIENGFSVAWDGDVSEPGFSSSKGIAVLPKNPRRSDRFLRPGPELDVDQEMRQETFLSYQTTDDHLMHITGVATDSNGTKYYLVKNSWGEQGPYDGYIHMSEAYVRLKTVSILLHKDGMPAKIRRD